MTLTAQALLSWPWSFMPASSGQGRYPGSSYSRLEASSPVRG